MDVLAILWWRTVFLIHFSLNVLVQRYPVVQHNNLVSVVGKLHITWYLWYEWT